MKVTLEKVVSFVVPGRPQQRGSKTAVPVGKRGGGYLTAKNGRPLISVTDSNKKSKAYMQSVSLIAKHAHAGRPLIEVPIALSVRFYFRRPQDHYGTGRNSDKLKPSAPIIHSQSPDLAKLLRCIEDGITGHVWLDDRLVFRYLDDTGRYWTEGEERAEVTIFKALPAAPLLDQGEVLQ
ncbi:MAG: RusA family crossover junction endodeoxyribonuclease [Pirellulales bacterium]